jgi:hypothetical protein
VFILDSLSSDRMHARQQVNELLQLGLKHMVLVLAAYKVNQI